MSAIHLKMYFALIDSDFDISTELPCETIYPKFAVNKSLTPHFRSASTCRRVVRTYEWYTFYSDKGALVCRTHWGWVLGGLSFGPASFSRNISELFDRSVGIYFQRSQEVLL